MEGRAPWVAQGPALGKAGLTAWCKGFWDGQSKARTEYLRISVSTSVKKENRNYACNIEMHLIDILNGKNYEEKI